MPSACLTATATGQIGEGLVGVGDLGVGALQIGVVLAHVVLDVDHLLLGVGAQFFQAAFQSRDGTSHSSALCEWLLPVLS